MDWSFEEAALLAYFSALQGVLPGAAAPASPESVLEMKNRGPHHRPTESETPGG